MASKKEDWDDFDDLSEFDDLDNFNFEAKEPEPGEPAYRKMLIGKYLGAVGGGVLNGIKKAAESELSESADVVSEIGDWGSDLSETWDTLKDATTEVIEQGLRFALVGMPIFTPPAAVEAPSVEDDENISAALDFADSF